MHRSLIALLAVSLVTLGTTAHAETSFVTIDSDVSGVGIARNPYTPHESPCYAPCMRPMKREGEYVVKGVMQDRVLTLSEGATHIVYRSGSATGRVVGAFTAIICIGAALWLVPIGGIQVLRDETPGQVHAAHIMLAAAAISAAVGGLGYGLYTLSEPTLRIEGGPAPKRPERPAIPRAASSSVRVQFGGTGVAGTF